MACSTASSFAAFSASGNGGVAGGVVGGVAVCELAALGAAAVTGAGTSGAGGTGSAGAGGTANVASSDRAKAITSGLGVAGVALSLDRSAGAGAASEMVVRVGTAEAAGRSGAAVATGAAGVAATALGLAAFFGLAFGGVIAVFTVEGGEGAGGGGGGARSTSVNTAGSAAIVGETPKFCALGKGSAAATGVGASTARSSGRLGTSIRRACHGKLMPGSPRCWPLKVRLNSSAWNNRESSSASVKRLRSGHMPFRTPIRIRESLLVLHRVVCVVLAAQGIHAGSEGGG